MTTKTTTRAALLIMLAALVPAPAVAQNAPAATDPLANLKHEVVWESVQLSAARHNPTANPEQQRPPSSQSLTVSASLRLAEPGNVVGFTSNAVTVTGITDEEGNDLTKLAHTSDRRNRWYQPLSYDQRFDHETNEHAEVLAPQRFTIQLKVDDVLPARFEEITGAVTVLAVEKVETVDVPFKAGGEPVKVIPGLTVRFTKAEAKGQRYEYQLEATNPDRHGGDRFDGRVEEGKPLPARFVRDTYLVDAAGKRVGRHRGHGSFGGVGSQGGSGGVQKGEAIAAMRYEVGVNPREVPVPFTLSGIDLPVVEAAARAMFREPAASKLPPVERMERALLRQLEQRRAGAPKNRWTDAKDARVRELWKAFVADHEKGATGVPMAAKPFRGVAPDAASYDDYVGAYTAAHSLGQFETYPLSVRKDDAGRLFVDSPEGPLPAVARDGAIFAVFDDVLITAEDVLDRDSPPKLAGAWLVRASGKTTLFMDTGRPQAPYVLTKK